MKVGIDLNKCTGHARCNAVDAELFQLDESGYALRAEVEIPPGEEERRSSPPTPAPSGPSACSDEIRERLVTSVSPRSAAAGYVPFFHVGILVRDIDQAAEDFSAILGPQFEPVRAAPVVSGEMNRFCYSLQGEGGVARVIFTRPELLHGIRAEYLESAMAAATLERLRAFTR